MMVFNDYIRYILLILKLKHTFIYTNQSAFASSCYFLNLSAAAFFASSAFFLIAASFSLTSYSSLAILASSLTTFINSSLFLKALVWVPSLTLANL